MNIISDRNYDAEGNLIIVYRARTKPTTTEEGHDD